MEENTTTTSQNNQNEECLELKNIKYKTMLLNGNPIKETKSSNDMSNLDLFLENKSSYFTITRLFLACLLWKRSLLYLCRHNLW